MALGKGLNSLLPSAPKKTAPPAPSAGSLDASLSPVKTVSKKATPKVRKPKVAAAPKSEQQKEFLRVAVSTIAPNPHQPRKEFGRQELEELVQSIKKHGIMQPLTVTERLDGGFELIAGERRFRAAQLANLATVPVIIRQATEQEKLELALIENIQRQELNPIEEAAAFNRLIKEFGLSQQQVADQVGKSRPAVANTVRLLDLPDHMQNALITGTISSGKARALLSVKDVQQREALFASLTGTQMTVREAEKRARKRSGKGSARKDPNLREHEERLEDKLGSRVTITQRGEKGKITIEYFSKEELGRILNELLES